MKKPSDPSKNKLSAQAVDDNVLRPVSLSEFLHPLNVPQLTPLPLVHTTESFRILKIMQQNKLFATPCNVFKGENLCYFFAGRPSYKFKVEEANPYYWQLPLVFVVRFDEALQFKRILPFDSGAFRNARLPSHLLSFDMDDFDLGRDSRIVSKLVATFFGSNRNYYLRQGVRPEDLERKHVLNAMHMEVLSLAQMYTQPMTAVCDDRSSLPSNCNWIMTLILILATCLASFYPRNSSGLSH